MKLQVGDTVKGAVLSSMYYQMTGTIVKIANINNYNVWIVDFGVKSGYPDGYFRMPENSIRKFTKLEKALL